jgi:uncharacterized protein YdhG (YjbR/CyaY superfamily)
MRTVVRPAALVESYFDTLTPPQQATVRAVQGAVLRACPQLEQAIKWGNLTFVDRGRNVLSIVLHKAHANFQVFNGSALAIEFPQLEGTGKGLRHLKLRYGQPVDAALVEQLSEASLALLD